MKCQKVRTNYHFIEIKSINEQNDDLEEQIESKNRRTAKNPDISRYRIIDKIDSNL